MGTVLWQEGGKVFFNFAPSPLFLILLLVPPLQGIPMLIYDQLMGWGNSVVALSVNLAWRWLDVSGTGLAGVDTVSDYAGKDRGGRGRKACLLR